jgi:transposase
MLTDAGAPQIYLARGATDLRKSIDGLAALVQQGFGLDPFGDTWFVFCNRERDKLKVLRWDHNGFWLYSPGSKTWGT